MSQVLRKTQADKLAFNFQPKTLETDITIAAKDFVEREKKHRDGFEISEIVSEQSRVAELRRKNVEEKVEETVLARLKEIEEQAYSQAYALGLQEGTNKAFEEQKIHFQERMARFDEVLAEVDRIKLHLIKENEAAFIKLVFLVGEKLAMRQLENDNGVIAEMLNNIIEGLHKDDQIEIHLAKADLDFIEELRKRNAKEVANLQNIKLVAAEEMNRTEFTVETNYGMIEASLKTRVEKVWEALKSKLPALRGHNINLKGKVSG